MWNSHSLPAQLWIAVPDPESASSPVCTTRPVPCPRDFVTENLNLGAPGPGPPRIGLRSRGGDLDFETWESTKLHGHGKGSRLRRHGRSRGCGNRCLLRQPRKSWIPGWLQGLWRMPIMPRPPPGAFRFGTIFMFSIMPASSWSRMWPRRRRWHAPWPPARRAPSN